MGLALVEEGNVVETLHWLVKPHDSLRWMNPFCTAVHGLTWEDVRTCAQIIAQVGNPEGEQKLFI